MAITATMKGPLMGFILLLTYANVSISPALLRSADRLQMVLDIIQITKACAWMSSR